MRGQCLHADQSNEAKAKAGAEEAPGGLQLALVDPYLRVTDLTAHSPPAGGSELTWVSPQVITSGIAAIVLSRYLPSIPLVCGTSWNGA